MALAEFFGWSVDVGTSATRADFGHTNAQARALKRTLRSKQPCRLVKFPGYNFHKVMRQVLDLEETALEIRLRCSGNFKGPLKRCLLA